MKLMSLIKGLVLAAMLACVAQAEQIVVIVSSGGSEPDISQVEQLLKRGWRVVHLTSAGAGSDSIMGRVIRIVFVLESPAPKETTK